MLRSMIVLSIATLLATSAVQAGNSFRDKAKVIDVDPIYETVRVSYPEEQCWTEEVVRHGHRADSATPAITGAIVGGVVGNQFGKGRGKTAMTVAGTILGASVGHDLGKHHSHGHVSHERRCEQINRYDEQVEVTGYRVKYRYKGETFWTTTNNHPGKFIPVRVSVRPAWEHRGKKRF